jgi:hypothetical protein
LPRPARLARLATATAIQPDIPALQWPATHTLRTGNADREFNMRAFSAHALALLGEVIDA